MHIREILLVLSAEHPHAPALAVATNLAKKYEAHIRCLCIVPIVEPSFAECLAIGTEAAADVINHMRSEEEQLPKPSETAFESAMKQAGLEGEFCKVSETVGKRSAITRANVADIVVLPRPQSYDEQGRHIIEAILRESGTPVLLVPKEIRCTNFPAHRVALAWNKSPAAKRAMDSGLDFLMAASNATILVGGTQDSDHHGDANACRMHLLYHNIRADVVRLGKSGSNVGSAIVKHCATDGIDLLIAGAFGKSPLHETMMGGTTHTLLCESPVLTLLSH